MFMRLHVEVMIGIFAHARETNNFSVNPLLVIHAIDPTEAVARGAKADHSTNPFSEFLNVIKSPRTGMGPQQEVSHSLPMRR